LSVQPSIVVFDIGNVLIEWSPRLLYAKLFGDRPETVDWFLANVCTSAWNLEADRGRNWRHAVTSLRRLYPEWRAEIEAFDLRWHEMVPGEIEASVALLSRLKRAGVKLYAITNFSAEKFAECRERFPFLGNFDGIVVSAAEALVKPDAAIYRVLFNRYGLAPESCVFIDDSKPNVAAARELGMTAILFTGAQALGAELRSHGFEV
jgi:FMN phosphatase YigB (HAD superfamily)